MNDSTENTNNRAKFKWIIYALSFLCIAGLMMTAYWFFFNFNIVSSDDARIDADMVDIAPQISGNLSNVTVKEGDEVKKGQVLFELDKKMLEANLEKAGNDLNTAKKMLSISETEYKKVLNGPRKEEILIAESNLKSAEDKLKLNESELKRIESLFKDKSVTESEMDKVKTDYDTAKNNLESARENLLLLRKGSRDEDKAISEKNVDLRKVQIEAYETALKQAEINLGYATVTAPFDGVMVRQWRKPGAMISQGTAVLSILNTSSYYISANIEEKYLHRISQGNSVDITIDSYPGVHLKGSLDRILQATNSKFSLIPSEGVSGTFIKVSQRIPVRIKLDSTANISSMHLGPGMSVVVHIHNSNDGKN